MSYTPTEWSTGDTITAQKLNNIEDGIQEAAQSGGGYDLVIESGVFVDIMEASVSDFTITSGSILDCEDKMDAGELVNAVCIVHTDYSVTPTGMNTNKEALYLPLTRLRGPYAIVEFGLVSCFFNGGSCRPLFVGLSFGYDPSDGSLISVHGSSGDLAFD